MDFDALAATCAPTVAISTIRAIATAESGLNPYAIGIVGRALPRQPASLLEGVATASALTAKKARYSAGIAQIYAGNWQAHGLTNENVFDPCTNLRAAASILGHCYHRASRPMVSDQSALRKALSCYYSNNFTTGFTEGYVQKVVAIALKKQGAPAPNLATNVNPPL